MQDIISQRSHFEVRRCGSCGLLHLSLGPMTLKLTPEAFLQFAKNVNRIGQELQQESFMFSAADKTVQ